MAIFLVLGILAGHLLTLAGSVHSVPLVTLEVTSTGTRSPIQYVGKGTPHSTLTLTRVVVQHIVSGAVFIVIAAHTFAFLVIQREVFWAGNACGALATTRVFVEISRRVAVLYPSALTAT